MLFSPVLPSRPAVETKIELLLNGGVRAFSPAQPLSTAEKVAFVTGRSNRRLDVRYGLYPSRYKDLNWASGAQANAVARSLFGRTLPSLMGRARVAPRYDQSMVDPYHARLLSSRRQRDGVHVRFVVHHWMRQAWDQGPDRNVGRGDATLIENAGGEWRVAAFKVGLRHE